VRRVAGRSVAQVIAPLRQFIDANNKMAYLVMMTARLIELHRVLKLTRSLSPQCDPTANEPPKGIIVMLRPMLCIVSLLLLSAPTALSVNAQSSSEHPSASECRDAVIWADAAFAIPDLPDRNGAAAVANGDLSGGLIMTVLNRHDIAGLPRAVAADTVRDALLATMDELIYQTALKISDPPAANDIVLHLQANKLESAATILHGVCGWNGPQPTPTQTP